MTVVRCAAGDVSQGNLSDVCILVPGSPESSINIIRCLRTPEEDSKTCTEADIDLMWTS